jgi:hypothetical protein
MSFLSLPSPDWDSVLGGDKEAAWIAARNRKVAIAAELGESVLRTARRLSMLEASYECSPQILKEVLGAPEWFLSLAGFSEKTLGNLRLAPRALGLKTSPLAVARRLSKSQHVAEDQLQAFANWINSEMIQLYPVEVRTDDLALAIVLLILGARIQGQVQNMAGDDAVVLLKTILSSEMERRGVSIEVSDEVLGWREYSPDLNLLKRQRIRYGGRLICEFTPGGNRPDIKILLNGVVIAVGEVKGRKDLSNLWESWVPQIMGHLRTWTLEHPDAPRLFFGTIITKEMIDGVTAGGTHNAGLRVLHSNGLLTAVYNLSLLAEKDAAATSQFGVLIDVLVDLIGRKSWE